MLLEDETEEKIRENVCKAKEKVAAEKVEMNKLSFQEKVTKMAEIKQLQQEFQDLCEQERTREINMEAQLCFPSRSYQRQDHRVPS